MNFPARIDRKSHKQDAGKLCLTCGAVLVRLQKESLKRFAARGSCGRACAAKARKLWDTPGELIIQNTRRMKLTGCWEWQGYRDPKGYGRCTGVLSETLAHRISYTHYKGEIPPGLHVLHACDNPRCCNPDHLSVGTNLENVLDRVRKGRSNSPSGPANGNYKHGKFARRGPKPPPATVQAYWQHLEKVCVCGAQSEHIHHIIHVNGQRITKDHWLVVPLCAPCHNAGSQSVHALGGEGQFREATGIDLVQVAILNRHNFEVRAR